MILIVYQINMDTTPLKTFQAVFDNALVAKPYFSLPLDRPVLTIQQLNDIMLEGPIILRWT